MDTAEATEVGYSVDNCARNHKHLVVYFCRFGAGAREVLAGAALFLFRWSNLLTLYMRIRLLLSCWRWY